MNSHPLADLLSDDTAISRASIARRALKRVQLVDGYEAAEQVILRWMDGMTTEGLRNLNTAVAHHLYERQKARGE